MSSCSLSPFPRSGWINIAEHTETPIIGMGGKKLTRLGGYGLRSLLWLSICVHVSNRCKGWEHQVVSVVNLQEWDLTIRVSRPTGLNFFNPMIRVYYT